MWSVECQQHTPPDAYKRWMSWSTFAHAWDTATSTHVVQSRKWKRSRKKRCEHILEVHCDHRVRASTKPEQSWGQNNHVTRTHNHRCRSPLNNLASRNMSRMSVIRTWYVPLPDWSILPVRTIFFQFEFSRYLSTALSIFDLDFGESAGAGASG